jgi:hypothetical protein
VQLRHAGVDQHARIGMIDDVHVDRHPLALGEQGRQRPLAESHAGVCFVVGRELDPSAVKGALSAKVLCTKPRFRRIRRGVYDVL